MRSDRTVHGLTNDGHPIVRYDAAGKWYLEPHGGPRRLLILAEAAELAASGTHYARRPGGRSFDAKVQRMVAARGQS